MNTKNFYVNSIFFILLLISSLKASAYEKDIEKLFDWTQSEYTVFFDSPATTQIYDVWRYRYYPNTDIYLGVNNLNEVYVLGAPFGGFLFVGMLNDLLSLVPENFSYTQILARIGMLAAGFPENFIYYNVRNPGMGPNGIIAFSGASDVNVHSTNANTNAVWTGRPGNLKVIIRENDIISGLPSNVLFDEKPESSGSKPPVITHSGHVAFVSRLKGAVNTLNDEAILVYVNGEVKKVIREGDPAPGFPTGTTIGAMTQTGFGFSDAGLIISGVTNRAQPALWFWDFNTVTLLVAGGNTNFKTSPLNEALEHPIKGCDFGLFGTPLINNNGDIIVSSTLLPHFISEDCTDTSFSSLLKIKSSTVSIIFDSNVQMFENDSLIRSSYLRDNYDLNAIGGVSFYDRAMNNLKFINSTWYKSNNKEFQLVSLSGEMLPDDFSTFIDFPKYFGLAWHDVIVNKNTKAIVFASDNTGVNYILSGVPRPDEFYSSVDQAAKSQLSLVAKSGMQPPGLNPTDFFKEVAPPTITSNDDIIFNASVESAIDGSNYHSLWRAKSDGTLHRLIYDGQTIKVGNNNEKISFIFQSKKVSPYRSIGNGQANRYSETGKVVFQGELSKGRPIYQTSYYD